MLRDCLRPHGTTHPLLLSHWSVAPAVCGSSVARSTTTWDTLDAAAIVSSLLAEPCPLVPQSMPKSWECPLVLPHHVGIGLCRRGYLLPPLSAVS